MTIVFIYPMNFDIIGNTVFINRTNHYEPKGGSHELRCKSNQETDPGSHFPEEEIRQPAVSDLLQDCLKAFWTVRRTSTRTASLQADIFLLYIIAPEK